MVSKQAPISVPPLFICFILGLFLSALLRPHHENVFAHNSISSHNSSFPTRSCEAPSSIKERSPPLHPTCIQLQQLGATFIRLRLSARAPTIEASLAPKTRYAGVPIATKHFNCTLSTRDCVLLFSITSLLPDTDYLVTISGLAGTRRETLCRRIFATLPSSGNLLRNAGFEEAGDAPHTATRFLRSEASTPRRWTPFYNGGVRLACGGASGVHPRSGACCAEFGYTPFSAFDESDVQKFFGAHQAVVVNDAADTYLFGAWFRVSADLLNATSVGESRRDALAMIVSWRWEDGSVDDGVVVPFRLSQTAVREWRLSCVTVHLPPGRRIQNLHVYFHRHDFKTGSLFVDDAFARPLFRHGTAFRERDGIVDIDIRHCSSAYPQPSPKKSLAQSGTPLPLSSLHLVASQRPLHNQLTIAVPLTADRVLRLEALSRLYGGGPVAAAVLVRGEGEVRTFARIWHRRPWLRGHVDVQFVYLDAAKAAPIPINALRNAAVRIASTKFVVMLDVDMTPATGAFACFRDPEGTFLHAILPSGSKRILTLPVFVAESGYRPARDKMELMNQLGMRRGTTYCLDSQKPVRVSRWYRESEPYEARFMAGYEPYGIGLREGYPRFDERFVGYGFNKISWALGAERDGFSMVVLNDAFVTHLSHVENEWVQSIRVPHYLNTWRRYFAFVAEKD